MTPETRARLFLRSERGESIQDGTIFHIRVEEFDAVSYENERKRNDFVDQPKRERDHPPKCFKEFFHFCSGSSTAGASVLSVGGSGGTFASFALSEVEGFWL